MNGNNNTLWIVLILIVLLFTCGGAQDGCANSCDSTC